MNIQKLKIVSSNPDLCGEWHKGDVCSEMIELDILKNGGMLENDWIEYVMDRVFSFDCSLNDSIWKTCISPDVSRIDFKLNGDDVSVRKS